MTTHIFGREDLKNASIQSLEIVLEGLRGISDLDTEHPRYAEFSEIVETNLINVKVELEERLGQPKGELHLTVIKGDKGKPIDFSVEVK